jgi:hypothetical protein
MIGPHHLLFAFALGALFFGTGIVIKERPMRDAYRQQLTLIAECEKELPRTQQCVVIAVPKKD